MKKHQFLHVDFLCTVKINPVEKKKLQQWLGFAGLVVEDLIQDKIIHSSVKLRSIQVSLLICGDKKIKQLNLNYRGKDKVTDVLSFPNHDNLRKQKYDQQELFLGDLAICYPQAKRQAKTFDIGFLDEFIHLFFHGLIHLLGYDHELSELENKKMVKWENMALNKFSQKKGPLKAQ